jgi:hypothetical protein
MAYPALGKQTASAECCRQQDKCRTVLAASDGLSIIVYSICWSFTNDHASAGMVMLAAPQAAQQATETGTGI